MRLPRAILLRLVRTAAFVWVTTRAALLLLGIVRLSPLGVAGFAIVVPALTWFDIKVNSERVFYGNLAVRPRQIAVIASAVTLILETVLGLALGAFSIGMPTDPLL